MLQKKRRAGGTGNRIRERLRSCLARMRRNDRRPRDFQAKFGRKGAFGTSVPYRKRFRVFYWLYGAGAFLLAAAILSGTVFGLSFAWAVTGIRVEGTARYRAEAIQESSGIHTGDLMLGFTASETESLLKQQYPLLASARIHRALDGTVTITVREEDDLFYTCHYGNYYLLSAATMRVIAVDSAPDGWHDYTPVYIGLPEEARIRVGETVSFAFLPYPAERESGNTATYEVETGTAEEEFAYIAEARHAIMSCSLSSHVTGMELSDRYDLWFLLDGKIKVRLGSMSRLEDKLSLAAAVLAQQTEPDGKALLDASDPSAVTYREAPDMVLPTWAQ